MQRDCVTIACVSDANKLCIMLEMVGYAWLLSEYEYVVIFKQKLLYGFVVLQVK